MKTHQITILTAGLIFTSTHKGQTIKQALTALLREFNIKEYKLLSCIITGLKTA